MSSRRASQTRLRIFGEHGCVWPVWGEDSEAVEAEVSPGLRQELLDWQEFWQEHQGVDDWDSLESAHEYVRRGRWLQRRLQRELDRPVDFL